MHPPLAAAPATETQSAASVRPAGGDTNIKTMPRVDAAAATPPADFHTGFTKTTQLPSRWTVANIQSLTLIPGEPIPLYVNRDFQITNAALAEDLQSETGRSVVKVTHNPISQSAFEEDSDFDSDEEDESFEGPEGDDEEDSEDSEEQEGDDDEDDEDMDSDDDEDDLEETSVLCSLSAGKVEQAVLNLTFVEGEVVIFEVSGEK